LSISLLRVAVEPLLAAQVAQVDSELVRVFLSPLELITQLRSELEALGTPSQVRQQMPQMAVILFLARLLLPVAAVAAIPHKQAALVVVGMQNLLA
jgi:hypothetical protein